MTKIDLITGFLGSGKTTFLKMYAKYFIERGEKICIIENDFGAINVDRVILNDIEGENCNLEMIVGGDGPEAHRRRLKTKLIAMGMAGYDRVLIEPSGIFDPDELFDILYEEPMDRWYEMGNIICIVDGEQKADISTESRFLLMSEAAVAGVIVVSKVYEEYTLKVRNIISMLNEIMEEFKCDRKMISKDIVCKSWGEISTEDFQKISKAGYVKANFTKINIDKENAYQTLFFFDFKMPASELKEVVSNIYGDSECGKIYRVKGFVDVGDGKKIEINATENEYITKDADIERSVLIVIGEKINRERLKKYIGEPSI